MDEAHVNVPFWYTCIQSAHVGMCGRYVPMNAALIEDAYPYERLPNATKKDEEFGPLSLLVDKRQSGRSIG